MLLWSTTSFFLSSQVFRGSDRFDCLHGKPGGGYAVVQHQLGSQARCGAALAENPPGCIETVMYPEILAVFRIWGLIEKTWKNMTDGWWLAFFF